MWREFAPKISRLLDVQSRAQYEETDAFLRIIIPAERDFWAAYLNPVFLCCWWTMIFVSPIHYLLTFTSGDSLFFNMPFWTICILSTLHSLYGIVWNWTGREFLLLDKDYLTVGSDVKGWRRSKTCRRSHVQRAYPDFTSSFLSSFTKRKTAAQMGVGQKNVVIATQESTLSFGLGLSESEAGDITQRINDWLKCHP